MRYPARLELSPRVPTWPGTLPFQRRICYDRTDSQSIVMNSFPHNQAAMSIQNPKRIYHKPTLRQYGTINHLTQNVADGGEFTDGAGTPAVPNKTE